MANKISTILISKEIALDPMKLYKELKRHGVEVSQDGQFKFFSIQQDPEDPELFWVSECEQMKGSASIKTGEPPKPVYQ